MSNVPAARQVLGILRYLARQPRPVPASAIARNLGLPRSTTYHLLNELVAAGFVIHLADDRRYGLGISAYELGTGYVRQEPLQLLARVPLSVLTDQTGHSSHLAVVHGREVLYVIDERAPGRPPLVTDVGVRLPAQRADVPRRRGRHRAHVAVRDVRHASSRRDQSPHRQVVMWRQKFSTSTSAT